MRCSAVIPCHNGAELTRACIDSLLHQDAGHAPAEILVVDNGSSDDTPQLGAMSPRVRVLRQPTNRGFAGGVNAGIREAREDLVLVVNNDTQAAANLLPELTLALTGHAGIGAVSPVSNHVKGHAYRAVGERGRTAAGRAALQAELASHPALQDVPTLAGLCLLVRRRTLAEVGPFDERFGHGNYEDDDFCLRLRRRGHRLGIAARAFLHHEGHATFKHLGIDLATTIARRQGQFVAKWQDDPAGAACVAELAGDVEGAARAALTARTVWPLWPDADWHLGSWRARTGDDDLAIGHFRALLRRCPHHADAWLALAQCLLRTGQTEAAQHSLRAAMHSAPSVEQQACLLRVVAEHAYAAGAIDDAITHFTTALGLTPHQHALHNWLGACHLRAARLQQAASHFERAVAGGVANAAANLGVCRARLGLLREAVPSVDDAEARASPAVDAGLR